MYQELALLIGIPTLLLIITIIFTWPPARYLLMVRHPAPSGYRSSKPRRFSLRCPLVALAHCVYCSARTLQLMPRAFGWHCFECTTCGTIQQAFDD